MQNKSSQQLFNRDSSIYICRNSYTGKRHGQCRQDSKTKSPR